MGGSTDFSRAASVHSSSLWIKEHQVVNENQDVVSLISRKISDKHLTHRGISLAATEADILVEQREMEEAFPRLARLPSRSQNLKQMALLIESEDFRLAVSI